MAFERLPQLRRPEETNVSARVLDVFYRPQTKQVDQTLSLLSESLERFNPNLQKYIQKKEEVTEKVDTAKAQADYNKNRTDFKNLIEKIGVQRRVYTAGKNKSTLDPFLDEKEEDINRLKNTYDSIKIAMEIVDIIRGSILANKIIQKDPDLSKYD